MRLLARMSGAFIVRPICEERTRSGTFSRVSKSFKVRKPFRFQANSDLIFSHLNFSQKDADPSKVEVTLVQLFLLMRVYRYNLIAEKSIFSFHNFSDKTVR